MSDIISFMFNKLEGQVKDHNDLGSGCTVTMMYIQESTLYFANVGDSRGYLITDAGIN
jgi:serine/threonine protein phosphatase PrpC